MPHHITKVSIQFNATHGMDGVALQQELSQWFWREFTPLLEAALDKAAPRDILVRLDKIELEIPARPPDRWQEHLASDLLAALEKVLAAFLKSPGNISDTPGAAQLPLSQNHFETWLYFLQTGQLPVHSATLPESERLIAVLQLVSTEMAAVKRLLQLLRQQPVVLERLVYQHEPAFLVRLLAAITGQHLDYLPALPAEIYRLISRLQADLIRESRDQPGKASALDEPSPRRHSGLQMPSLPLARTFERQFWMVLFGDLARSSPPFSASDIAGSFIIEAIIAIITPVLRQAVHISGSQERPIPLQLISQLLLAKTHRKDIQQAIQIAIGRFNTGVQEPAPAPARAHKQPTPQSDTQAGTAESANTPASTALTDAKNPESADDTAPLNIAPGQPPVEPRANPLIMPEEVFPPYSASVSPPEQSALTTEQLETSELYIQNAGLVLLHPFIAPLFEATGITTAGHFEAVDAADRAVQLLQYLVTGTTEAPEYELALPKLLCGLPFSQPIERQNLLDEATMREGASLLQAVISHWGALGKVSNDSLREGFLKRDGKLSLQEDGNWLLQVENQTLDILFNKLPWGLGIIKLKWMKQMLFVEWG